jgi:cytochrome c553
MMKNCVWLFVLALLPTVAVAADGPDWAYPVAPQGLPRPDPNKLVRVPGSDKQYTEVQVNDAKGISPEDARAAAQYFSTRKQGDGYIKVVETAEVPKTYVGEGAMRFVTANGGDEPLGNRIIVVPQDEAAARARNPRTGFVAYVPPGSISKGEALATTGGGKTVGCAICHGEGLEGLNEIPSIAGREPMYLVRQLTDIKNGNRVGTWTVLMNQVVAKLDGDDIIALAAYVASRQP